MPISKENMKRYPGGSIKSKEWQAIRDAVKQRSGDKCEFCKVPNGELILRGNPKSEHCGNQYMLEDGDVYNADTGEYRGRARLSEWDAGKFVKIVLTVMHLDHMPENNDMENLKHGCQRCHNRWDAPHRRKNAERTRRAKGGQKDMFAGD